MNGELLWQPTPERAARTAMADFRRFIAERTNQVFGDTAALHRWSVDQPDAFWNAIWDYFDVIGHKGETILADGTQMPGARFFPEARLNFAENLLARRGQGDEDALVFIAEDKAADRWSWSRLVSEVSRLQQAFAASGVEPGDRVAAYLPNMPIAIAAMLAATSLGAVWCSASPDFGPRGVLDRFGQIEPKLLITVDAYWYAGKKNPLGDRLAEIVAALPSVGKVVVADLCGDAATVAANLPNGTTLEAYIAPFEAGEPTFKRLPFDHPVYILFSSGTTGVPKCIVHRAGGVLLQHLKEHALHADVRAGDRLFYFTTLGWMMWNWLASGLATGATLLLYDGSPFHPGPAVLFDYAEKERMTHFGTSAKYIDAVKKAGLTPHQTHDLTSLRAMMSTGSPLVAESFDFVYRSIGPDLHLASISGGTDIVSCFVLGDPTQPVRRGEIQGPGLGLSVEVWTEDGKRAPTGEKGELVCTKPFTAMPLQFWNDPGDVKYRGAYFERFEGVWCHGDFAELTESGGFIIHGRSDATLNPGGVRIGTAEIYAQVEKIPDIMECIAIGQDFDGDVRVVLFVRMRDGAAFTPEIEKRIRQEVRSGASPRHVPARIVPVADIPRTRSGKIVELAVRDIVHGRPVRNQEALANPEALDLFRDIPELAS
ncbi:acetoacetyl-CoA synthetase [Aureimonas altamirensis DSM 21988]|uniref:Acetoacetyl-CoA synthetase n=1 Tax=Aureimonas altamirensis DSM 21988 TaxID=1121026 RepID=A0ABY1IN36_9HYPH|nr:acetoacetate--CoA ligase [Aureimonas altamirensis]SHJ52448.1 acetoacetyl-CoA synthetase [Aureimonas altamirensis DSM 21988]